ncbi:MAG: G3E family GTPase [Oleispira sp.]|jgi:G3E family GTPase
MTKKVTVNIIMGFLGVGKTTSILNILQQKPADEKWAVLVNEFGEVGIDGAILSAASGMVISEVPGGCLCCVSGIPFQSALSSLIVQQQPHRILIEPTGLGHPKNLIRTLTSKEYQPHIEVKASICLLDPRQLKDPRYQQHETFNDQCYLADVLVANKTDICDAQDKENFYQFAQLIQPVKSALGWVEQGELEPAWLDLECDKSRQCKSPHPTHYHSQSSGNEHSVIKPVSLAVGQDYQAFENEGMGYYSLGWLLSADQIFAHQTLTQWLMALNVERVKGLLITDQGTRVMNLKNKAFTEMPTRKLQQSRIEIIHNQVLDKDILEKTLLNCLVAHK